MTSHGRTAAPADLYDVLGVPVDASQSEILAAVKREAKKWHPDTNKTAAAEQRMRAVNKAKSVLRDPAKRAAYDRTLPPWLDMSRVNLGVLRAGDTQPAASTVRVCSRVDAVESLRFEPEYGEFWRIHSAKRQRVDSAVVEFEIAADVPATASAGAKTATLAVVFNGVVLELVIGATILAARPAPSASRATPRTAAVTGSPASTPRSAWPTSPVSPPLRSPRTTAAGGSRMTTPLRSTFRPWRTIGALIGGVAAVAVLAQVLAGPGRDASPALSQTNASTDATASPDAVAAADAFSRASASANSSLLQDERDIAAAEDANRARVTYAAFAADERTFMTAVAQIAFPEDVNQPLDRWVSAHQALTDTFTAAAQASTPDDYGSQILAQSQTAYDSCNAMRSALELPPIAPGDRA